MNYYTQTRSPYLMLLMVAIFHRLLAMIVLSTCLTEYSASKTELSLDVIKFTWTKYLKNNEVFMIPIFFKSSITYKFHYK
jgi:hypothetical protein